MRKTILAIIAMVALFGMMISAADAAYVTGAPANSSIVVGGDAGSANQVDLFGDVVASYTSTAGNDTQFRSTLNGQLDSVSVKAVFGDSLSVIGTSIRTIGPGLTETFILSLTNFANQTDIIKFDVDSADMSGPAKDSVTVRVNGLVLYQNGVDTFPPFTTGNMAPGADTQITVTIEHDPNGLLGQANVNIVARANNGAGGDTGGYSGLNGDSYAGFGNDARVLTVNVNQINVLMRVEQDMIQVPANYNGSTTDSVPGSILTYVIRYDNDGNDTAVNFAINVKIPANTQLNIADTTLVSAHTGAAGVVTITDDSGTPQAPGPLATRIKWTFNIGVAPNNGDANGVVDATSPDVDAGYVKFKVFIK